MIWRTAMEAISAERMDFGDRTNWPAAPWLLSRDGQDWAVTTDGRVLLAVHREQVEGECLPVPDTVAKLAAKWIPHTAAHPAIVSVARLKAFAEMPPAPTCETCKGAGELECDDCDGAGSDECECHCGNLHDADCETCDGNGVRKCPSCQPQTARDRAGDVLGIVVDRRLLASVLRPVDDETVAVSKESFTPSGASEVCVLRGAAWLALIMMTRVEASAVFDAEDVGATTPTQRRA